MQQTGQSFDILSMTYSLLTNLTPVVHKEVKTSNFTQHRIINVIKKKITKPRGSMLLITSHKLYPQGNI